MIIRQLYNTVLILRNRWTVSNNAAPCLTLVFFVSIKTAGVPQIQLDINVRYKKKNSNPLHQQWPTPLYFYLGSSMTLCLIFQLYRNNNYLLSCNSNTSIRTYPSYDDNSSIKDYQKKRPVLDKHLEYPNQPNVSLQVGY